MDAGTAAVVATAIVTPGLGWLTVRATNKATQDTKAASALEARDRLLDQVQEERDHDKERIRELEQQVRDKDDRIQELLTQQDLHTGQIHALEEEVSRLQHRGPQ